MFTVAIYNKQFTSVHTADAEEERQACRDMAKFWDSTPCWQDGPVIEGVQFHRGAWRMKNIDDDNIRLSPEEITGWAQLYALESSVRYLA